MNITTLGQDAKHMTPNGFCLNPEERVHVRLAIMQLKGEMALEEAYFWGKIEGKLIKQIKQGKLYRSDNVYCA